VSDIRIPYWQSRGRGFESLILQGAYIFGSGSNGVENWNADLIPRIVIDMTEAFWSIFFSWGQQSLSKPSGPESGYPGFIKRLLKIYITAKEMKDEDHIEDDDTSEPLVVPEIGYDSIFLRPNIRMDLMGRPVDTTYKLDTFHINHNRYKKRK